MSTMRILKTLRLAILASASLLPQLATGDTYYLIGQVSAIDVIKREIVIDGQALRLSSSLRFSSERDGLDLVAGVRPGTIVKYNAAPDGRAVPVTELHLFEQPPL